MRTLSFGGVVALASIASLASTDVVAGGGTRDLFPYSINVHFTLPSYSGCNEASVADAALSCDAIQPSFVDAGGQPNYAWLLVDGVPDGSGPGAPGGIGGIQFGLDYPATVSVGTWTGCTGGTEIPEPDWPASGSGYATQWSGGCRMVTENPDGLTRIGFLVVDAGSDGTLSVACDPRIGRCDVADCQAAIFSLCPSYEYGVGDTSPGGTDGVVVCGFDGCADCCFDWYFGTIDVGDCREVPTERTTWGGLRSLYD